MAASKNPQTPADLAPAEFADFCIAEVLATLSAAESAADRLAPGLAFDVGCALEGARQALDQALRIVAEAQPQPQARQLAA
jgi:uncharacterized metal-binding protein